MIDTLKKLKDYIISEAARFGGNNDKSSRNSYIIRDNTKLEKLDDEEGFFGLISPGEPEKGPYHDFSLVLFPHVENVSWIVSLGVGSLGFKNDYELALTPGVRRLFTPLLASNSFCKTDFTDIESNLPRSFAKKVPHLKNTLARYGKLLTVCEVLEDVRSDFAKKKISAFVAAYAKMRDWPSNLEQRKILRSTLSSISNERIPNYEEEALSILTERKYIILEGPPGTGKTRLAQMLADRLKAKAFLTQFHSEVSYSDFVKGIRPTLSATSLVYHAHEGILMSALEAAKTETNVVLIIDEMNRANLSAVLGPLFYLLEYGRKQVNQFQLPTGDTFPPIPNNFFIVGTMNTADRNLAVVDFALRRRFAWIRIAPHHIKSDLFYKDDFDAFEEIFKWHASSTEINLQPGQAYFLAPSAKAMERRIQYELYPLIQEYLAEGIMMKAREEFNEYFIRRIGKSLFE